MMRRWWKEERWKDGRGAMLRRGGVLRLNCTIAVVDQVPQSICPENLLRARGEQEEWVFGTFVHVFEGKCFFFPPSGFHARNHMAPNDLDVLLILSLATVTATGYLVERIGS